MITEEVKNSLITYAMIGAIGYLFNGVSEGKHERDIFGVHLEYLKKSDDKQWTMFDAFTAKYIESLMEENNKLKGENQKLRDGE